MNTLKQSILKIWPVTGRCKVQGMVMLALMMMASYLQVNAQDPTKPVVYATSVTDTGMEISWDPSVSTSSSIESYQLIVTENGSSTPTATISSATSPHILNGLSQNTTYLITVKAVDATGNYALSTISKTTLDPGYNGVDCPLPGQVPGNNSSSYSRRIIGNGVGQEFSTAPWDNNPDTYVTINTAAQPRPTPILQHHWVNSNVFADRLFISIRNGNYPTKIRITGEDPGKTHLIDLLSIDNPQFTSDGQFLAEWVIPQNTDLSRYSIYFTDYTFPNDPMEINSLTFFHSQCRNSVNPPAGYISPTPPVDITSPVITLVGANPMENVYGTPFTDPGYSATDDFDGDVSSSVMVTGSVDINTVGSYTLSYDVSDAKGNVATTVTRTVNVIDNASPVITLLGDDPLQHDWNTPFTDSGATATDNVDGDITDRIVVDGTTEIETSPIGSYSITYNVSDEAGNAATTVTRTVNVVDPAGRANPWDATSYNCPTDIHLAMFNKINDFRAANGKDKVSFRSDIVRVADLHAWDNLVNRPCDAVQIHKWSGQGEWTGWMAQEGDECYGYRANADMGYPPLGGQNLQFGHGIANNQRALNAVDAWENSPGGHPDNMLCDNCDIGVGYYTDPNINKTMWVFFSSGPNQALSDAAYIAPDATPGTCWSTPDPVPVPPTDPILSVDNTTETQITLSWTASSSDLGITNYHLEVTDPTSGAVLITKNDLAANSSSFTLTGQSNTTYRFKLKAEDVDGNFSGESVVDGTTLDSNPGGGSTGGGSTDACLSDEEKSLYLLINQERVSRGLPRLTLSPKLTTVARLHAQDIAGWTIPDNGHNPNEHSWSPNTSIANDVEGANAWVPCIFDDRAYDFSTDAYLNYASCMWEKPNEITNYGGDGYENFAFDGAGMTAQSAFNKWMSSPGHYNLFLELQGFNYLNLTSMGVGIIGDYAYLWVGEEADGQIYNVAEAITCDDPDPAPPKAVVNFYTENITCNSGQIRINFSNDTNLADYEVMVADNAAMTGAQQLTLTGFDVYHAVDGLNPGTEAITHIQVKNLISYEVEKTSAISFTTLTDGCDDGGGGSGPDGTCPYADGETIDGYSGPTHGHWLQGNGSGPQNADPAWDEDPETSYAVQASDPWAILHRWDRQVAYANRVLITIKNGVYPNKIEIKGTRLDQAESSFADIGVLLYSIDDPQFSSEGQFVAEWVIPANTELNRYRIKFSNGTTSGENLTINTINFWHAPCDEPPAEYTPLPDPCVAVTAPAGLNVITTPTDSGDDHTLEWTSSVSELSKVGDFDLAITDPSGSSTNHTIAASTLSPDASDIVSISLNSYLTDPVDGEYTVVLTAKSPDECSVEASAAYAFTITTVDPCVAVVQPAALDVTTAAVVGDGTQYYLVWAYDEAELTKVGTFEIALSGPDAFSETYTIATNNVNRNTDGLLKVNLNNLWTSPPAEGVYTVSVAALSPDQSCKVSSDDFNFDLTDPADGVFIATRAQCNSQKINWGLGYNINAADYVVNIGLDQETDLIQVNGTPGEYTLLGLASGTEYTVYIKAEHRTTDDVIEISQTFTTLSEGCIAEVTSSASTYTCNTVQILLTFRDDIDVADYQVELAYDEAMTNPELLPLTNNNTIHTIADLSAGTELIVFLRATNNRTGLVTNMGEMTLNTQSEDCPVDHACIDKICEHIIIDDAGNVGIGKIPDPDYKLDVDGPINASELYIDGTSTGHWTKTDDNISYSGGNVGIGNVPNPTMPLHVEGSVRINNGGIMFTDTDDSGRTITGVNTIYGQNTGGATGVLDFKATSNIHSTFGMRLTDSGLGIGTTDPSEKLEVAGNVKATSFIGDGSQLTSLNAFELTGSLPALDGANLTNLDWNNIANVPDDLGLWEINSDGKIHTDTDVQIGNLATGSPKSLEIAGALHVRNQAQHRQFITIGSNAPYLGEDQESFYNTNYILSQHVGLSFYVDPDSDGPNAPQKAMTISSEGNVDIVRGLQANNITGNGTTTRAGNEFETLTLSSSGDRSNSKPQIEIIENEDFNFNWVNINAKTEISEDFYVAERTILGARFLSNSLKDADDISVVIAGKTFISQAEGSNVSTSPTTEMWGNAQVIVEGNIAAQNYLIHHPCVWDGDKSDCPVDFLSKYGRYWGDYVFEDEYELLELDEVKSFIDENSHLPGVPSAEEIMKGYTVHDMNRNFMVKIEELTLYTIQQQEEIKSLKAEKAETDAKFTKLSEEIETLKKLISND